VKPEDAHVVDYDERDLRSDPPANAVYSLPQAPIDKSAFFSEIEKQLKEHLYRSRATEVFANRELKLYSRAGESRAEFIERCRGAAADRADADASKLRDKVQSKLDRLEKRQRTAEDRVRELTVDTKQRVQHEIVAGAGQLLSVFLRGRGSVRSLSGAASRRGITRRTQERLDTAKGKVEDASGEMREIEEDLREDLAELQAKWDACAEEIETKSIPLEKSDIAIEEIVLLWVPVPA
jgi:chromosome segregation ATPase